jgi:hypothetical protein
MAAPNIETSNNPSGTGGNQSGIKVGISPDQTIGFFGNVGSVQLDSAAVTTVANVVTVLQSYGLLK